MRSAWIALGRRWHDHRCRQPRGDPTRHKNLLAPLGIVAEHDFDGTDIIESQVIPAAGG
jgi:hypothetical protein